MPDSFFSPPWGPPSFDERDLDSLLAGETDVPDALRPVADTLSALRTTPSPRELRGEAFIRAQFHSPRPEAPARHAAARRATGRRATGPRATGRRPTNGWFAGLVAVAAVIVLVLAVTYTGHLPGPAQRIAHNAIAAPPVKHDISGNASPGTQARSAQPEPSATHRPAISGAPAMSPPPGAPNRAALCDAFWAVMEHPPAGRKPWQTPAYDRLSVAAGGPQRVFGYCFPVWNRKYARQYPLLPSVPPYFPKQWNSAKPGDTKDQQGDGGPAKSDGPGDNGGPANGPGGAGTGPQPPSATPSGAQQQGPGQ
jgi:hypothetical protein